MEFHYYAYGLKITSQLELPELLPITNIDNTLYDVAIRYASVPSSLNAPSLNGVLYQAQPGYFLLNIPGVAHYLAHSGNQIEVDPEPDCDAATVRLFLLNSVLAALLQQRGLLVLHASAIRLDEGALTFLGGSGSGKSALAAAFYNRGYSVLCDDVCVIDINSSGVPYALSGFPQLLLWKDMLTQLSIDPRQIPQARPGMEKYSLNISDRFSTTPAAVKTIYLLTPSAETEIKATSIQGQGQFQTLKNHTYLASLVEGLQLHARHFQMCMNLCKSTAVKSVQRPVERFQLDELVDFFVQDCSK